MDFKLELREKTNEAEEILKQYFINNEDGPKDIFDSASYSLFAGGKRIRPVLVLASNSCVKGNIKDAYPLAAAMEMIHTYSLIHDDLPCMDDDELRRGKPTNHVVYGEALALLAGDSLLNMAYEVMIEGISKSTNKEGYIKAMEIIAKGAGIRGMVAGQVWDMLSEGEDPNENILNLIHTNKTGALLRASVLAGAYSGGANSEQVKALEKYGIAIGLMFQVVDDMLDIVGDEKTLGKKVGADKIHKKMTYPYVYGVDKSKEKIASLYEESIDALKNFGREADFLRNLAKYLVKRTY